MSRRWNWLKLKWKTWSTLEQFWDYIVNHITHKSTLKITDSNWQHLIRSVTIEKSPWSPIYIVGWLGFMWKHIKILRGKYVIINILSTQIEPNKIIFKYIINKEHSKYRINVCLAKWGLDCSTFQHVYTYPA